MTKRGKGDGSIYQRKDGRWAASLQVGGVRKVVYAPTEREARQRLAELRRQAVIQGALPDPGTRTVGDLLDALFEAKAHRWRPRTLQDWLYVCNVHVRPALGRVRLSRLTPERIQRVLSLLEAQDHHRTALKVYRAVSMACALGVKWNWLAQNPCMRVERPRYQPDRKDVWTQKQLRYFLRQTEGHWLQPLWVFLVASGCRLGEALGLTRDDVDWQTGTVIIRRNLQRVGGEWLLQEPKTKAGERTLILPPQGLAALKRQRAQQAQWRLRSGGEWQDQWDLLFTGQSGQPLNQGTVTGALRGECERLGLPRVTPHGLRHLHASLLLANGLPLPAVSARLGHATAAVTLGVYAHSLDNDGSEAVAAIRRALE